MRERLYLELLSLEEIALVKNFARGDAYLKEAAELIYKKHISTHCNTGRQSNAMNFLSECFNASPDFRLKAICKKNLLQRSNKEIEVRNATFYCLASLLNVERRGWWHRVKCFFREKKSLAAENTLKDAETCAAYVFNKSPDHQRLAKMVAADQTERQKNKLMSLIKK